MTKDYMLQLKSVTATSCDLLKQRLAANDFLIKDFYSFAESHTTATILRVTYGNDLPKEIEAYSAFIMSLPGFVATRLPQSLLRILPLPIAKKAVAMRDASELAWRSFVDDVLANGEQSTHYRSLTGLLVSSNAELGNVLSDFEVRSNAIGFGVGGNDSTASAFTSIVFLLATHPNVQQKLVGHCLPV